jgi:hypothetical protein
MGIDLCSWALYPVMVLVQLFIPVWWSFRNAAGRYSF